MKGKQIDEFFRKGLADPDIPYQEGHWKIFQEKIEKRQKRKRIIGWWTRAGGIAAMLLIGLLIWDAQREETISNPLEIVKSKPAVTVPDIIRSEETSPAKGPLSSPEQTQNIGGSGNNIAKTQPGKSLQRLLVKARVSAVPVENNALPSLSLTNVQPDRAFAQPYIALLRSPMAGLSTLSSGNGFETAGHIQSWSQPLASSSVSDSGINRNSAKAGPSRFRPSLTLSLTAAPDLNGVNNLTNSQIGLSGGLVVTFGVARALSISTGVAYAKKIYRTEYQNYKPNSTYKYPVTPLAVDADCRVIDIPFNINYTVWNNSNNKIQITAGTSSYIMLDEKYKFSYTDPNAKSPKSYHVKNKNKHYLGIVNLAAKFEKDFNNKVGFGIQPYFKLPVTDIGYGNVRLESAGVALQLNYNLFPRVQKP